MTQNTQPLILPLDDVSVGMSLAEPVLSAQGDVVLSQGVALTESLLNALRRRGITSLSVLGADWQPYVGANDARDVQAHLARLERLFRRDAEQSGSCRLRALVTQYRMRATP